MAAGPLPGRRLTEFRRIVVVGSSGAGKTVFAGRLAALTGLPLCHLDHLWWQPGWRHVSREEFDQKLAIVLGGDAWIVEGFYPRTLSERLRHADAAVVLDYPRALCLWRATRRWLQGLAGRGRETAPGCPARIDRDFLARLWRFPREGRPEILAALAAFRGAVFCPRSPREAERLLATPPAPGEA